jgi:hypothetical protein
MRIQSLHRDGYADHLRTCAICDQRNCPECVLENRIFSSQVTRDAKVVFTSTGYENLS